MAAVDAAAITAEIAASLTMEDTPMKLRCSVCSLLAVGAVRMPCCDQNICESCEASLDKECPVCLHANVDRDLIKPNKTLRTTIKAFLKKKAMEKENLRRREEAARTAAAVTVTAKNSNDVHDQLEPEPAEPLVNDKIPMVHSTVAPPLAFSLDTAKGVVGAECQSSGEAQMDVPRPSIETVSDNLQIPQKQVSGSDLEQTQGDGRRNSAASEQQEEDVERGALNGQWLTNGDTGMAMSNVAVGVNGMNGASPMDFTQIMQYMPNGIPNNLMGTFPNMMGMPAMGLDPMAITQAMTQSMFGGFSGPGMGMNMGMGFNAGQSAFVGFNGQLDAWTTGQDNYNANAYGANGMGGNFGAHAGHGGYNMSSHQGNFNQLHHQSYLNNDFHHGYNNHGYQNRGRGRRGFYNAGRGQSGYTTINQGNQNGYANHEPFHHPSALQTLQRDSILQTNKEQLQCADLGEQNSAEIKVDLVTDIKEPLQVEEDQINKETKPGDEDEETAREVLAPADTNANMTLSTTSGAATELNTMSNGPENGQGVNVEPSISKPLPIETLISSDEARMSQPRVQDKHIATTSMPPPVGPAFSQGSTTGYPQDHSQDQSGRGRGTGRGLYHGAVSGRGDSRGRGGSYVPYGNGTHTSLSLSFSTANSLSVAPMEPRGLGVEGAPTGPKALREKLPNIGLRGGRGFSIVGRAYTSTHAKSNERTRSRSPSVTRHRSRSRSRESSQHQSVTHRSSRHRSRSESDEGERERRKERRRRRSHRHDDGITREQEEHRHRDLSVESISRRSTHRSHRRHHDKESGTSSHRRRRDRSRDHGREEERKQRRKRSRSPVAVVKSPISIDAPDLGPEQDTDESRKRREREWEDDDRQHDRKRSRRDRSASLQEEARTSHNMIRDHSIRGDAKVSATSAKASMIDSYVQKTQPLKAIPTGPKEPETDHHTLERDARNRERLLKEMQRRAATEGTGPKRKGSGLEGRIGGRKLSYKYEDEEGDEARTERVEKEREAARWG